jgi:hypothetical protein
MSRSFKEINAKSYISTNSFRDWFFSYTVKTGPSPQFAKTGQLGPVKGITNRNCPAGRILRENGKKLYPGVHDGITVFMVGVFDSVTLLSGFINPNAQVFAPFSGEKPLFMPDTNQLNNEITLGAPVYTQGHVYAANQIVSVGGQVRSDNVFREWMGPGTPAEPIIFDATLGQTFIHVATANSFIDAVNPQSGSTIRLIMNNQDATGPFTVTFGPDVLKSQGPLTIPVSKIATVTFVSEGVLFYETSRTVLSLF